MASIAGAAAQVGGNTLLSRVLGFIRDLVIARVFGADAATDAFNEEMELTIMSAETETIREIDYALSRIDEGTYGHCEMCSEQVAPKRLKAIPYARYCIECQSKSERGE